MVKTEAKVGPKAKKGKEQSQLKTVTVTKATPKRTRSSKQNDISAETNNSAKTEKAYERLLRKVNENKRRATDEVNKELELVQAKKPKATRSAKVDDSIPTEHFWFQEDDNFIEMEVLKTVQGREFPSPSDEESQDEVDSDTEEGKLIEATNNNRSCD